MSTRLTLAAASAKQFGLAALIILPIIIAGRFGWIAVSNSLKPKPTPTPIYTNASYGVLPKLAISEKVPRSSNLPITLNTPDLQVPQVFYQSPTVPVYEFIKRNTTFDYINNINSIAKLLGITSGTTTQLTPTLFRLSENNTDGKQLQIDIQYYHLNFSYQNPTTFIPIEQGSTVTAATAIASAQALFNQLATYLQYSTGKATTLPEKQPQAQYYYRSLDGNKTIVANQSQSNITTVSLFRPRLNDVPFVSESTVDTNIAFSYTEERATVTSGGQNRPRLLTADITYWPVSTSVDPLLPPAIYPLKSVTQAYQEIIAGQGYVLSPIETNTNYQILSAYLAYFEPTQYTQYAIPIWVFEGDTVRDPNTLFRVIVPAIATGYITE